MVETFVHKSFHHKIKAFSEALLIQPLPMSVIRKPTQQVLTRQGKGIIVTSMHIKHICI
jgi:hypothetical protein